MYFGDFITPNLGSYWTDSYTVCSHAWSNSLYISDRICWFLPESLSSQKESLSNDKGPHPEDCHWYKSSVDDHKQHSQHLKQCGYVEFPSD